MFKPGIGKQVHSSVLKKLLWRW